jgi:DHA2 family multidrug resistance protein
VTFWRSIATTDMGYWQIAVPLIVMGVGLPFFFVPVTALSLASVEEHEVASAAGLQNFLRTLSGAVATSIVNTVWEDETAVMHAELAGYVDRSGETAAALARSGMLPDAVRSTLENLLQGQSVMLATNEIMAVVALVCALSALVIWLAPRPMRSVDMAYAGH